ncbi:hypothetical protein BJ741DRAFT_119702 [Chytriomyces cf. hyalinus JEL632]|nr:hypothetical protein BJ741DRAFT_119702 [Chytriomyces cf. hyalinus JEL632]
MRMDSTERQNAPRNRAAVLCAQAAFDDRRSDATAFTLLRCFHLSGLSVRDTNIGERALAAFTLYVKNLSLQTKNMSSSIYSNRCGTSWPSANTICGQPCSFDSDCVSDLRCFTGLDVSTCTGGVVWNASLSTGATVAIVLVAGSVAAVGLVMLGRDCLLRLRRKGRGHRDYVALDERDSGNQRAFHTAHS